MSTQPQLVLPGDLEAIPMKFLVYANKDKSRDARMRRLACTALLVAFITCLFGLTPAAYGQASSSSDATGKVTDQTGAAIPGAQVHLINNATGSERTATTNDNGDWSIPNLPPANYKVRVE